MSKKPDDASRVAGLASILKATNAKPDSPLSPAPLPPAAAPESNAVELTPRKRKEKVGKYRDPDFKITSTYLRKTTMKRARRKWEDLQPEKDFSDLLQMLLEQWLEAN
ncbi:hypothetical protein [Paludisphaera borealis]|nr:hypothetical protein [Paludisphaera borealis]